LIAPQQLRAGFDPLNVEEGTRYDSQDCVGSVAGKIADGHVEEIQKLRPGRM